MKNNSIKKWKIILIILVLVANAFVCCAGVMFREELKITNSIRSMAGKENVYYMEIYSDYHFEEFLGNGGALSDGEVSAFLTNCISKGFYQVDVTNEGPSCSVISALDDKKCHVWGRNFDWDGAVPIIVK
ncbi:MAG: linear amide C-N hydrolase, partial [Lachnospiraceae bacterium]|nr:linear amide C-N hydrolase [Lachnospiraceae bacterium]